MGCRLPAQIAGEQGSWSSTHDVLHNSYLGVANPEVVSQLAGHKSMLHNLAGWVELQPPPAVVRLMMPAIFIDFEEDTRLDIVQALDYVQDLSSSVCCMCP